MKLGRTVVVMAAAALSLALPAGAWACNNPEGGPDGVDPAGVPPGGTVPFVIGGEIDEGASWKVTLHNEPVPGAAGFDDNGRPGYRGSFRMPAVEGPSRELPFMVEVEHEDVPGEIGYWPSELRVRYRAPSSASPELGPPPAEQPAAPQPQAAPQQADVPSGSQPTGIGGSAPVGGTGGTGGVPPSGPGGSGGGPTTPSAPGGPSGGPLDAGADVAIAVDEPTVAIEDRALAPAARAALPDQAMDGARRPLQADSVAPTDSPDGSGRILLVLLALTAAGSAAALAFRWRRGGSGPAAEAEHPLAPSDPAVEAELQEIIAEERAKLPRAPDERPPAELAAARDDPG